MRAGLAPHLQHHLGPHFSKAVRHKLCFYQSAHSLYPKVSFLHIRYIPFGTGIIYNSKIIPTNGEERARQAWSEAQKHKSHLQFCRRVQLFLRLLLDLAESGQEVQNLEGGIQTPADCCGEAAQLSLVSVENKSG